MSSLPWPSPSSESTKSRPTFATARKLSREGEREEFEKACLALRMSREEREIVWENPDSDVIPQEHPDIVALAHEDGSLEIASTDAPHAWIAATADSTLEVRE